MEKEIFDKYMKAGSIAAQTREYGRGLVKEGVSLLEIAEKLEKKIIELGGEIAFPACLSIDNIAAHQSPVKGDKNVIPHGAMVKLDVGTHIDGYIGDTAITIDLSGENEKIVEASKAGLKAAIEQCYAGNIMNNVSEAVEEAIKEFGLKPISNLTGHSLGQFSLHESPSVSNISTGSTLKLREGQVFAIEPFATPGDGFVKDANMVSIYRLNEVKPMRNQDARKIINYSASRNGLPFSERWLPMESIFKIRLAFREMREKDVLIEYPALKEVSGQLVSQAEHTVIVGDKPTVTTLS